jgi:hypothetical protein
MQTRVRKEQQQMFTLKTNQKTQSQINRIRLIVIGLIYVLLPGLMPGQNAVTEWNDIAVKSATVGNSAIPSNSPNGTALYLAYIHLAIHDAANAIEHRYKPFGPLTDAAVSASQDAAVAAAAYTTLEFSFPDQSATLRRKYKYSLATISDAGKADGIAAGMAAANQLIALRAGDGHGANVPYR